MNISTSGHNATFLLGQQLPNGLSIYHDHYDHKMYSQNPSEVTFLSSNDEAKSIFRRMVHDISTTSNLLPGDVKRLGLFMLEDGMVIPVDTVELNSWNTAKHRDTQSFHREHSTDITRTMVPVVEEYATFESDGFLD